MNILCSADGGRQGATFGDSSVGGYQSGLVRADEADGLHLETGVNVGNLLRVELEADAVWATNEETGLDNELLAGIGVGGSLALPGTC